MQSEYDQSIYNFYIYIRDKYLVTDIRLLWSIQKATHIPFSQISICYTKYSTTYFGMVGTCMGEVTKVAKVTTDETRGNYRTVSSFSSNCSISRLEFWRSARVYM